MKYHAGDWGELIEFAELWESLDDSLREQLLLMQLYEGYPKADFGDALEPLFELRLLEPYAKAERVRLHPERRRSFALLRILDRNPILADPDHELCEQYLREMFVGDERDGLLPDVSYRERSRRWSELAILVTSSQHVRGFLDSDDLPAWERARKPPTDAWNQKQAFTEDLLTDPRAAEDARRLVRLLTERREPFLLTELRAELAELDLPRLGQAVFAAVRYALAFPALSPEGDLLSLALWPAISERLHRKLLALPDPLDAGALVRSFEVAWGLEDLTQLLVAAAEPIRLRGSDHALFAKAARELEAALLPLPDAPGPFSPLHLTADLRVGVARRLGSDLGYLEQRGTSGKSLVLALTGAGRAWLARPAGERLRLLMDHVLPERQPDDPDPEPEFRIRSRSRRQAYLATGHFSADQQQELGLVDTVRATLAPLADGPRPVEAFLAACQSVGFPDSMRAAWTTGGMAWSLQYEGEDAWEKLWLNELFGFLVLRLWAFGGLRFAWSADDVCTFELTGPGRYLLALATDFDYGSDHAERPVRVQPDFEVIFLAPSPTHEAAFSRFAERIGTTLGALFRITRASIHAAAHAGLTAAEVLADLAASSDVPLPRNVTHEVEAWFAECLTLELQPALLLRCPDPPTAARVRAAAGRHLEAAGDTLLFLPDPKKRSEVQKLCRKAGIFLSAPEPEPGKAKKPKRRRRYW